MFDKSTRSKQVCQLFLSLIVGQNAVFHNFAIQIALISIFRTIEARMGL